MRLIVCAAIACTAGAFVAPGPSQAARQAVRISASSEVRLADLAATARRPRERSLSLLPPPSTRRITRSTHRSDLRRLQREEGLEEGASRAAEPLARRRPRPRRRPGARAHEGQGPRARAAAPPPPPARKSDGPGSTPLEGRAGLGAAPRRAARPRLPAARGALTQGKKQREAEQQAASAARGRSHSLTMKAAPGRRPSPRLAGVFAVGPVTDALGRRRGKGKSQHLGQGPVPVFTKLGGWLQAKSKADPSEAWARLGQGPGRRKRRTKGRPSETGRRGRKRRRSPRQRKAAKATRPPPRQRHGPSRRRRQGRRGRRGGRLLLSLRRRSPPTPREKRRS